MVYILYLYILQLKIVVNNHGFRQHFEWPLFVKWSSRRFKRLEKCTNIRLIRKHLFSYSAILCTSRYSDTHFGDTLWHVSNNTTSVFHQADTIPIDTLLGGMEVFFIFYTPKKYKKCISYLWKTCTAGVTFYQK